MTGFTTTLIGVVAGYVLSRLAAEWLDLDALAEDAGLFLRSVAPVDYNTVRREVSL